MPSVLNNPLVRKAAWFAKEKHKHQKRRTGKPYFTHAQAVAKSVAKWSNDPNVVAAAYLHDVIEDTGCDYEDLLERFGKKVASYVALASRDFRKPKKESLKELRRELKKAPPEVKLIAAADLAHNASSFAEPDFMKQWFKKAAINARFIESGNSGRCGQAINFLLVEVQNQRRKFFKALIVSQP
jgi:(p)ppGpp synthase/HD superfamily hydrolase